MGSTTDIDGLDEASGARADSNLRRLIELARSQDALPSSLVILLTARLADPDVNKDRLRVIQELTSTEHPEQLVRSFGVVKVHDFTDEELTNAAQQLDPALRQRLDKSLRTLTGSALPAETFGDAGALDAARPVANRDLLESLRHPALWGEFADLPLGVQEQVLDATPAALHSLAKSFLARFCRKVSRRRPSLSETEVIQALRQIAGHPPDADGRRNLEHHWIGPAIGKGLLRRREADDLFREAVSYGMIETDEPGWWRWRHRFIADSLRNQGE